MKNLSIYMIALSVVLVVGSGFKIIVRECFTGYQLYIFSSADAQPTYPYNTCALGQYDDQQSTEYDLDQLIDPSPDPGDELCEPSSEVCVAQVKVICDECDESYGVDFRTGSIP